jgi:hypothetical protein
MYNNLFVARKLAYVFITKTSFGKADAGKPKEILKDNATFP